MSDPIHQPTVRRGLDDAMEGDAKLDGGRSEKLRRLAPVGPDGSPQDEEPSASAEEFVWDQPELWQPTPRSAQREIPETEKERDQRIIDESHTELDRAIARQKSYLLHSLLVFALYWVFYFPGVIANLLFLREALDVGKVAGRNPSGTGLLVFLLLFGLIPLLTMMSCLGIAGAGVYWIR